MPNICKCEKYGVLLINQMTQQMTQSPNYNSNHEDDYVPKLERIAGHTKGKSVRISQQGQNMFLAFYIQIYNGEEQVLHAKAFRTMAGAQKWAKNKLL